MWGRVCGGGREGEGVKGKVRGLLRDFEALLMIVADSRWGWG